MGPRLGRRGNDATGQSSAGTSALQWGRVSEDAETTRTCLTRGRVTRLQWGRVSEDAETGKCVQGDLGHDGLQWGRVSEDAETRFQDFRIPQQRATSMGPRLGRRGNPRIE